MTTSRSRLRLLLTGVACATMLTAGAGPVSAAPDGPLDVTWDPAPTFVIGPGESALWPIQISTKVARLDSLELEISASGSLLDVQRISEDAPATFDVQSCSIGWQEEVCGGATTQLLEQSPLSLAAGQSITVPVRPTGSVSWLLVRVTLAPEQVPGLAGRTAQLRVRIGATGELAPDNDLAESPHDGLAVTGFRLLGYALLGAAAVAGGIVLSGWAERRPRRVVR